MYHFIFLKNESLAFKERRYVLFWWWTMNIQDPETVLDGRKCNVAIGQETMVMNSLLPNFIYVRKTECYSYLELSIICMTLILIGIGCGRLGAPPGK